MVPLIGFSIELLDRLNHLPFTNKNYLRKSKMENWLKAFQERVHSPEINFVTPPPHQTNLRAQNILPHRLPHQTLRHRSDISSHITSLD